MLRWNNSSDPCTETLRCSKFSSHSPRAGPSVDEKVIFFFDFVSLKGILICLWIGCVLRADGRASYQVPRGACLLDDRRRRCLGTLNTNSVQLSPAFEIWAFWDAEIQSLQVQTQDSGEQARARMRLSAWRNNSIISISPGGSTGSREPIEGPQIELANVDYDIASDLSINLPVIASVRMKLLVPISSKLMKLMKTK